MKDQYILLEFSKVHDKLDGYVFSLVFFDVTAPSSLFGERFSLVFFNVTAPSSLFGEQEIPCGRVDQIPTPPTPPPSTPD